MKKFVAYITKRDVGEDVYDKETIIEANDEKEALDKWIAVENKWFFKLIGAERTDDKTIPGYASFAYAKNHLHFEVTMKEDPIMTEKEISAKLEALAKNGIVSYEFLLTIGLYNDWFMGNGKKVECYRNFYLDRGVPKSIQDYIDKGYMICIHEGGQDDYFCFKVTEEGFVWLSELLGIKVEELK